MPNSVTHDVCPYTCLPLATLDEVSDEHIFPDALGGVKDYCVKVSRNVNSELGTRIDAPLINSFGIAGLRLQHGIKSRSGHPAWRMRGKESVSDRDVEVVLRGQGEVQVKLRSPVIMADDGRSGTLVLTPKERDSFLKQFIENHKRKGRTVKITSETKTKAETIKVPVTVNLLVLKRAIAKIAFLAVYEFLGDAFLKDPLIPEWHKAFLSPNEDDVRDARIHGQAFNCQDIAKLVLPPLKPYEHAVAVVNLQQKGPVVAVALFGNTFYTLICLASETSNYGLSEAEGRIAVCDAKAGRTLFVSFMDHLARMFRG